MKKFKALFAAAGILLAVHGVQKVRAATFAGGHLVETVASTATAAGTSTLTIASPHHQRFTGSTTHTVVLPSALTLKVGMSWVISNDSSGAVTVNQNGGSTISTLIANEAYQYVLVAAPDPGGTWDAIPYGGAAISSLTGDVTASGPGAAAATIAPSTVTSNKILDDTIVDGDINSAAAISDTKLGTISTAGKVSNSATTATASNTMSAIMARDASGQVAASTFTGALVGNASTSSALAANPADCAANNLANVIGANGDLSCVQVDNNYVAAAAAIAVNKLAAVTANRAVVSDASGFITQSATTDTEIGYVSGVTSSIQTQLNALSAGASTVQSYEVSNVGITATADSGAHTLTLGLTQANGSACSSGASACKIGFRSSTATSGQFVQRAIVAAPASLVIPSTATMGHVSAVEGLLHFYALDVGASGVEIGVTGHRILNEQVLQTSTAIGVTSDFNSGFYSTTARSNVPVRYLGTFKSTQTTAGTWDSAVTAAALTPAQKLPVFWLGDWLARLAVSRVSADPAASGEWRTLNKTAGAVSFTDGAPTTNPSSANGMQIFSVSGTGAGGTSSDAPNRWEFFGEKNMRVVYYFYSAAAHTGRCAVSYFYEGTGSQEAGLDYGYSDRTGIGYLTLPLYTSNGTRYVGRSYASGTASASGPTSCYWDALVYEQ